MPIDPKVLAQCVEEAYALSARIAKLTSVLTAQSDQDMNPGEAADMFIAVRESHESMNETRKVLWELHERISNTKIPEIFEKNKVKTVTTTEGHRVTIATRITASMLDKPGAMAWLRDSGHGDIIQETVNAGTLGSLVKEMIETDNVEPPANLISVKSMLHTSLTKAKPKKD